LRLLLAAFSSKISSDVNRPFGDEVISKSSIILAFGIIELIFTKKLFVMQFRAARKVSEEIGAQIVLGDRPIEITVCGYYMVL
jgi:phage-related baseplate assembly protein